jgi:hypothetical protein
VRRYATPERARRRRRSSRDGTIADGLPYADALAIATVLRRADPTTRSGLVTRLQEHHGNAAVAELLEAGMLATSEVMESMGVGEFFGTHEGTQESEGGELPIPTASGTTITTVDTTFPVSGTLAQVATTLEARSEAGSVTSQISDIYLDPAEGSKPVRLANITVTETRSLPTWSDRPKASEAAGKEWDRFHSALAAHEDGHIAIDKSTFDGLHRQALGKKPDDANKAIDAVNDAATKANDEYDTKTDHGKKTGTTFTLPAEPAEKKESATPG